MTGGDGSFDDIDRRLHELGKNVAGGGAAAGSATPAGNAAVPKETNFEDDLREMLKNDGVVEVFEGRDGRLVAQPVPVMDRYLLYSMVANAVLFALFVTKAVGLW